LKQENSSEIDEEELEDIDYNNKIEFNKEDRKEIIENSKLLKEFLKKDNGNYIISCFETIPRKNFEQQMFDNLIKSLQYKIPQSVVNLLLSALINQPFFTYEIKEVINDDEINKFIDEIYIKYSYRISKLYKISIGERDWQYIQSNPLIKDNALALTTDVTITNGERFHFTAPIGSVPILSYHFLKHMNKSIDFLKERAIREISVDDVDKVSNELKNLLDRMEKYQTELSEKNEK